MERGHENMPDIEIYDFYPNRGSFNKKLECDKRILVWCGEEEVDLEYLKQISRTFSNGISQVAFIRQQNVLFYNFDYN